MVGCMDGQMDGWAMDGWMDGLVVGCVVDAWMDKCKDVSFVGYIE